MQIKIFILFVLFYYISLFKDPKVLAGIKLNFLVVVVGVV